MEVSKVWKRKLGGGWSILMIIIFKWVVQTPTRWSLNVCLVRTTRLWHDKNCSCCLLAGRYVKWKYIEPNLWKFELMHREIEIELDLMEPKITTCKKTKRRPSLVLLRALWWSVLGSPSCSTVTTGWRQMSAWRCFGHSWRLESSIKPLNALLQASSLMRWIQGAPLCWSGPLVRVCVQPQLNNSSAWSWLKLWGSAERVGHNPAKMTAGGCRFGRLQIEKRPILAWSMVLTQHFPGFKHGYANWKPRKSGGKTYLSYTRSLRAS